MKIKATGILLAIAVMMTVAALPAAAATNTDVGVFQGDATVSKNGTCGVNGLVTGHGGGGIGAPVVGGYKNAVFGITSALGSVQSVLHGPGSLNLCGNLTGPLNGTAGQPQTEVGASCAATRGYGGQGQASFTGRTVTLSNLGWEATVGGSFIVTADASANGKTAGTLVAAVQALSEGAVVGCVTKLTQVLPPPAGPGAKSGQQGFIVVAGYAIV